MLLFRRRAAFYSVSIIVELSLFYKHLDALATTLAAKDRVLAHNPCGAIYCAEGYFKERL